MSALPRYRDVRTEDPKVMDTVCSSTIGSVTVQRCASCIGLMRQPCQSVLRERVVQVPHVKQPGQTSLSSIASEYNHVQGTLFQRPVVAQSTRRGLHACIRDGSNARLYPSTTTNGQSIDYQHSRRTIHEF